MDKSNVLPADFDGVFRFTNFTDRDFTAKWNSVEYTFPANKTSPMPIRGATPEEVQNIRKKFARELAEREFYGTDKFKRMDNAGKEFPATYTESDLQPFIQQCLTPLPIAQPKAKVLEKDTRDYRKDNKGRPVSKILEDGESLIDKGAEIVA